MFAGFIAQLRAAGVPASLTEYLTLLRALKAGCADYSVEGFYFLARSALVKDERLIDRFDRVFAHFFRGLGSVDARDRGRPAGGMAEEAGRAAADAGGDGRRSRRWAAGTS